MKERYFTDEELVAYLDGEDDFAPMDAIAQALKTDIALAKRLEALRIDTNALSDAFDQMIDEKMPRPSLPFSNSNPHNYRQLMMAACVALTLGFGGGYLMTDLQEPDWKDYVAAYQALYTNSTLNHVNSSDTVKQQELDRVASAIGKTIDLTALQGVAEIEYKRSQVLGFEGQALIQLAFLTSTGEPMALCILRSDKKDAEEIITSLMEGMSAASWMKNGYEYILIGGKNESLISRLAKEFSGRAI